MKYFNQPLPFFLHNDVFANRNGYIHFIESTPFCIYGKTSENQTISTILLNCSKNPKFNNYSAAIKAGRMILKLDGREDAYFNYLEIILWDNLKNTKFKGVSVRFPALKSNINKEADHNSLMRYLNTAGKEWFGVDCNDLNITQISIIKDTSNEKVGEETWQEVAYISFYDAIKILLNVLNSSIHTYSTARLTEKLDSNYYLIPNPINSFIFNSIGSKIIENKNYSNDIKMELIQELSKIFDLDGNYTTIDRAIYLKEKVLGEFIFDLKTNNVLFNFNTPDLKKSYYENSFKDFSIVVELPEYVKTVISSCSHSRIDYNSIVFDILINTGCLK